MTSKSIILPRGNIGITFDGSPPKIIRVAKDSPVQEVEEGLYAQTLIVPGCEMSFIPYAARLVSDLQYFEQVDRTLVFRDAPLTGPPIWKLSLPLGPLGIIMKGFPPVITTVENNSEFKGLIQEGMTVDRLIVPGVCDLNLASGGFTDTRVTKMLNESQKVEGRILVLTLLVGVPTGKIKSKNKAFDLEGFKPSKGWSLGRMFNKGGNGFW
mmetsp:Transcript_28982/g.47859  ORF Transcript_28982/g.47859 Transcript_28982/m.47859 type:complete len:211 (-) Transcript_28982:84-716(-)|eukprot:CAMPEP_0119017128 /NCGR_PEP_ID=MMETSP1176-20130426/15487_1 /TAXON_ID=265551 /ORGANISM="Synedropsis recta cf, Strain CCMP1620" /LENGTH=210 /DNA_ID=CAMNT_0006970753 /DNA_START=31 /DNA_END=663 /DNA_ORIENTATION=-